MDKIEFKKLLFKVAFCTMACDGHIHDSEIEEMKLMDKNTSFFEAIDLSDELKQLINDLDKKGTKIIEELFQTLKINDLNPIQELLILEVALRIINADDKHDHNELKFLHLLRAKLVIHDETIIDRFGEIDVLHINEYSKNISLSTNVNEFIDNLSLPGLADLKETDFKFK